MRAGNGGRVRECCTAPLWDRVPPRSSAHFFASLGAISAAVATSARSTSPQAERRPIIAVRGCQVSWRLDLTLSDLPARLTLSWLLPAWRTWCPAVLRKRAEIREMHRSGRRPRRPGSRSVCANTEHTIVYSHTAQLELLHYRFRLFAVQGHGAERYEYKTKLAPINPQLPFSLFPTRPGRSVHARRRRA